jgi:hypothetical protein
MVVEKDWLWVCFVTVFKDSLLDGLAHNFGNN